MIGAFRTVPAPVPPPGGLASPPPPGDGLVAPVDAVHEAVQARILDNWPAVFELETEWRALLERSDGDPLFLSWEWLAAWYAVCGQSKRPFVVTARGADGRLIGIAPFYRAKASLFGVLPYRGLRPLADYPTGAEYLDWIVDPDCPRAAVDGLARALAGRRDWDVLWQPFCAGWTGASMRIVEALQRAGIDARQRDETFAAMPLADSFDSYLKTLSTKRRGKVRQAVRRALEESGAHVQFCESRDDIPRFLDALFELHGRRWHERGQQGTFLKKPTEAAFYRRFAPVAFDNGWLRLAAVVRDGQFLAVQIGYRSGGAFYQIQEGFDPQTEGVGNALRATIIERCISDDRLREYDFLQGWTEGKARWGAAPRVGHSLFAIRRRLRTLPLHLVDFWPTGQYFRFTDLGQ